MKIVSALESCPTCEGFLPAATARCPHCGTSVGWSRRAKNWARIAGGSAIAVTMMACYGAPPPGPMPTDPPDPSAGGEDPSKAEAGDAKAEAGDAKAEAGAAEGGESKADAGVVEPESKAAEPAPDPSAP